MGVVYQSDGKQTKPAAYQQRRCRKEKGLQLQTEKTHLFLTVERRVMEQTLAIIDPI